MNTCSVDGHLYFTRKASQLEDNESSVFRKYSYPGNVACCRFKVNTCSVDSHLYFTRKASQLEDNESSVFRKYSSPSGEAVSRSNPIKLNDNNKIRHVNHYHHRS